MAARHWPDEKLVALAFLRTSPVATLQYAAPILRQLDAAGGANHVPSHDMFTGRTQSGELMDLTTWVGAMGGWLGSFLCGINEMERAERKTRTKADSPTGETEPLPIETCAHPC